MRWSAACSPARWALPRSLASVIERHHAEDATDEAAIVRLADMLAHYVLGGTISPSEMLAAARTMDLSSRPAADGPLRAAAAGGR